MGPVGGEPGEECGEAQPPTQLKKFFKFMPSHAKNYTKSITSQKLRIAIKKSFMQKRSTRSIPIYPAKLATFEES